MIAEVVLLCFKDQKMKLSILRCSFWWFKKLLRCAVLAKIMLFELISAIILVSVQTIKITTNILI